MSALKREGLTVEVLAQNATPEMIFNDGVPFTPVTYVLTEKRSDALHIKLTRFRTTVEDYGKGKITRSEYTNERLLAMYACDYGDFILELSPDDALEAACKITDRKQSSDFARIAECLEKRQTYTHRCF